MKSWLPPFMRNRPDHSAHRMTPEMTPEMSNDLARARLSHRLIMAQLVGKGSLGIGFISLIFGVTDHKSWALRTGLALLLTGMIASFVSLVHSFNRRRLTAQSLSNPPRPPKERRPGSS